MGFVSVRFHQLRSKFDSIWHCIWGKQHQEAFHWSRTFETESCNWLFSPEATIRWLPVFVCQLEDGTAIFSNKLKHPVWAKILCVCLRWEKTLAGSVHSRCNDRHENCKPSLYHGVWGGPTYIVIAGLHAFSCIALHSTERPISSAWWRWILS